MGISLPVLTCRPVCVCVCARARTFAYVQMAAATACAEAEGKIPDKKLKTIQTLIEAGACVMQAVEVKGEDEAGVPSLEIRGSRWLMRDHELGSLPPEIVHLMMNVWGGSF